MRIIRTVLITLSNESYKEAQHWVAGTDESVASAVSRWTESHIKALRSSRRRRRRRRKLIQGGQP